MLFRKILPATSFAGAMSALALAAPMKSPDGHLVVDVRLVDGGGLVYRLERDGVVALEDSHLGLLRADGDFSQNLKLIEETPETPVKDDYTLPTGKRRLNSYRANGKTYRLATASGQRMDAVFQISNDGLCFRYTFPEKSTEPRSVISEETSFRLPAATKAWLQPMSPAKSGWAKTNPSYEEYHLQEIPTGTPSPSGAGWVFPALFRSGELWVLLSEAGVSRGYCGTRLRNDSPEGEYRIGFPDPRETIGSEPVAPLFKTPYATPWRVIVAGSLKTVVESTLGTDVANPAIPGAKLLGQPGKSSWSWPKLGDGKTVYQVQREFIDYAAEMKWSYCLVDAMWDKQIGYPKLKELAGHAKDKGIGLLVWYNSNGDWNDAYQTPKNLMLDRETRLKEFSRLREMGVCGVKIDFFGGDGRVFMDLYQDMLEDAAKYGLLVNFHGTTLPRGLERTYPNLMTAEAVRGYEFVAMANDQKEADRLPAHMAMLPFTRNVFDPMDFTPVCFTDLQRVKRPTTVGAELASAVLFTSGIQHYVEIPQPMAAQPDYVRTALQQIPSIWEDTRFLAGYPGKLAVIARKGADGRWWIGGLNGENVSKAVEIDLKELGPVTPSPLITDATTGGFERVTPQMTGSVMKIQLLPHGGFLGIAK